MGKHADEFAQALHQYDTVLMGRKTYEIGFEFGVEPGQTAYPSLKHYVFSPSLNFISSEIVTLVDSNVTEEIYQIKQMPDKDIWLCGGGELAAPLLAVDLTDKVTVKANPVLFGAGRKFFWLR